MKAFVVEDFTKATITKPFLTCSVWQTFMECPALFYFQYIKKIEGFKNTGLAFGNCWDSALNEVAQRKLDGKGRSTSEIKDVFVNTYEKEFSIVEWKEKELFTDAKLRDWVEKGRPKEELEKAKAIEKLRLRDWGVTKVNEYMMHVEPTIRPKAVQKKFFIDFGDALPFGIKGTIDRIDEDGTIVDNKTSKNRWTQKDLDYDLQGVVYSLAYRIMTGKIESKIQFDVLVKTKTQSFLEHFQQLVVGIEPHKFGLLIQEFTSVFSALRAGVIFRRLSKFTMSCSWCQYEDVCWKPSQVWSRPPRPYEVDQWLAENPNNQTMLNEWAARESERLRLPNFTELGEELKQIYEATPEAMGFWY